MKSNKPTYYFNQPNFKNWNGLTSTPGIQVERDLNFTIAGYKILGG